MIRRYVAVGLLAALLGLLGFVPTAVAQGDSGDDTDQMTDLEKAVASQTCATYADCPVGPTGKLTANDYDPGDVAGAFANQGGPSGDVIPQTVATPAPAAAAADDVQAPQLAFTGAETDVLTWVGSAMIATGALALVARRRLID